MLLQVLEKYYFTNFNSTYFLKTDIVIKYYQLTCAKQTLAKYFTTISEWAA